MESRVAATQPAGVVKSNARCRQTGELIYKQWCYALRREDGSEIWLEMDRIPLHLVERQVMVEGIVYGGEVLSVERIGPD